MDHGVVSSAEEREVALVGGTAVGPMSVVVRLGPRGRNGAPGVGAVAIPEPELDPLAPGHQAPRPAEVHHLAAAAEDSRG